MVPLEKPEKSRVVPTGTPDVTDGAEMVDSVDDGAVCSVEDSLEIDSSVATEAASPLGEKKRFSTWRKEGRRERGDRKKRAREGVAGGEGSGGSSRKLRRRAGIDR